MVTGCEVLAVDFHPRGTILATASDDHSMRVWDLRKRRRSTHSSQQQEWCLGSTDFAAARCTHNLLLHNKLISEAKHRRHRDFERHLLLATCALGEL